jgi:23S rRNA (cytosine1962-C5)-methyltransferase
MLPPMSDDPATRPAVMLQPSHHKRAEGGHPWVYSNEIRMDAAAKALPPGGLVTLRAGDGHGLGVATFNPHTLIAARLLDRDPARRIDAEFIGERLIRALRLRERLFDGAYYRLVHAEADGLPGLVVDRFGEVLVAQANTAGMAALEGIWCEALERLLMPAAIFLKNDSPARALEGLAPELRFAKGERKDPLPLVENGVRFLADPYAGQKTGWFYDQRDNRRFMAMLAPGARVLDLYCYSGGFAVTAAVAGAREVLGIDRSETALALAAAAAEANGVAAQCRFVKGEAFADLARLADEGARFDIAIADPPAFVKSKKDLGPGLRGYRKLARLAAALVAPSGLLFIASCSHNAPAEDFAEAVRRGVADAGRSGRILRSAGASPDHPIHPFLPESAYLKAEVLALD